MTKLCSFKQDSLPFLSVPSCLQQWPVGGS